MDELEGRKKIMYRTKHGKLVDTADLMDQEEEGDNEANEIIRKFKEEVFRSKSHDQGQRATKVICTMSKNASVKDIKTLLAAGMDVARINMDYVFCQDLPSIMNAIKQASNEVGVPCPIMIDLKGLLMRTLSGQAPITVEKGQEIRMTSNRELLGNDDIFVIDAPDLSEVLETGETLKLDYETLELTVTGIESEEDYLNNRKTRVAPLPESEWF